MLHQKKNQMNKVGIQAEKNVIIFVVIVVKKYRNIDKVEANKIVCNKSFHNSQNLSKGL